MKIGRKHEEEQSDTHSMKLDLETKNGGPVACHDMGAQVCGLAEVAEKLAKDLNMCGFTNLNGRNETMRTYQKKAETTGTNPDAKKKAKQPRKPSKRKEPLNSIFFYTCACPCFSKRIRTTRAQDAFYGG